LRPTQPDEDVVLIRTDRTVRSSRGTVATDAGLVTVTVPARAGRDHGVVEVTLG
jgi:hypothetical protein